MGKHYDNYDYEEAYQKDLNKGIREKAKREFERKHPLKGPDYEEQYLLQQKNLEEFELERLLKEGKVDSLYRTTTTKIRNLKTGAEIIEAQVYPTFGSARDVPRTARKRESRPSQKNLNDKRARRHLIRLVNINFGPGDIWATFGWDKLPEDIDRCRKDIQNYFKRVKRRRQKLGLDELKYIYVLAYDGYTRPHVHIIMSGDGMSRDEIEAMWGKCSRPNTKRMQPDEGMLFTGLASYVARNPHGKKRWCCSKNLVRPSEPTRSYSKFSRKKVNMMVRDHEEMKAQMEKAYPGFKFVDAEVQYNGVSAAFYIYARLTRS